MHRLMVGRVRKNKNIFRPCVNARSISSYDPNGVLSLHCSQMEQQPSHPKKGDIARWKRQRKRLAEALGVELPEIGDEKDAPPVDDELIQGFIEKRISVEAQRRVDGLIWRFHSWAVAWSKKLKWSEGVDPEQIR